MTRTIFLTVTLPFFIHSVLGGYLNVQNSCSFAIFCQGAKGDGTDTGAATSVGAGSSWTSPLAANDDNIGATLKCSLSSTLSSPYQLEMAVAAGRSWLDLSRVDGAPFEAFHRSAEWPGTSCPVLDCPAGSSACEWPTQIDCATTADVWMYLC
ncbi:uncharacterized protein JN550_008564 [Neoarthrinium moseri]|uniref:uncharacterized protein n=1 Tax=Neoarthrinium moseri TaxID=1658444 RepID=UPI001FDE1C5F|nr:uncharacterized protein JN550_008564 [Neoarthrinium moseri]KAI1865018.1 hypothetical protein JN550_008564 [Neoarthrinium moseri]